MTQFLYIFISPFKNIGIQKVFSKKLYPNVYKFSRGRSWSSSGRRLVTPTLLAEFWIWSAPCILACEKRDQSRAGQNPGDHNLPRPPTNATAVVSCNEVVKRFCAGSVRPSVCLCVGRPTLNAADVSGWNFPRVPVDSRYETGKIPITFCEIYSQSTV